MRSIEARRVGEAKLLEEIKAALKDTALEIVSPKAKRVVVKVAAAKLKEAVLAIRDELGFDYFVGTGGVDFKDKGIIQIIYYVFSTTHHVSLMIKVDLPREKPEIESMVEIWPPAEYHEREAWEMFGINFKDHPGLQTLLLPEDWDKGVYPLRKDFELKSS